MANIVSIDWSVEEFRRLIGEQPHSSGMDGPLDKTVRVLDFEASSSSGSADHVPIVENTDSPDVEVASEGSRSLRPTEIMATENDDSSDTTVADVIAIAAVRGERSEEPTSPREAADAQAFAQALDTALHIPDVEVARSSQTTDEFPTNVSARSSEIATSAPEVRTEEEGIASAAPIEPDAPIVLPIVLPKAVQASNRSMIDPPAPSVAAESRRIEPRSALKKAIAEPDIHTSRADRDRAIELRWILRDIRGNRLKWSPLREHDLRVLIECDFVEMRDGVPRLTNAGVSAII